jgi:Lon protease-like protein
VDIFAPSPTHFPLPTKLAILPVRDTIILPGARLPLQVVVSKHLPIVEAGLKHPHRLMGLVQTADDSDDNFYSIGTVCRIMAFEEVEETRYHIFLHGICRMEIRRPVANAKVINTFNIRTGIFPEDHMVVNTHNIDRAPILATIRRYFAQKELQTDWDVFQAAPLDRIITIVCMMCPFSTGERQAFLEADTLYDRMSLVLSLMDMASHQMPGETGGSGLAH